jgi:Icc-related predicted phosphoesterase
MKILALSDLHLHFWNNSKALNYYKTALHKQILDKNIFDCIVISGDIWEYDIVFTSNNPFKLLRDIFENENIPIICCLGNHEFAYSSCSKVLNWFNSFEDRYNIHLLDIENHYLYNNINFVGNVFWYDNTLSNNPFSKPDKIVSNWLDSTIQDFIPSKENQKCKEQILSNLNLNEEVTNILVTHTVPHLKLNWFSINKPESLYNQYSGCKDFLCELKNTSWSICGHTHKRMSDTIYNINCINPGNDYFDEYDNIKHYLIDTQGTQEL